MRLTRFQRKTLENYRRFHDTPPSFGRMIMLAWRGLALLIVYFMFLTFISFYAEISSVGFICIGMCVGALSRDLGLFRRYVELWPVLSQVFNWPKINELLADETLKVPQIDLDENH